MHDICLDNRFKLIEKYKKELIESTNIETSQDEMAVLDNLLFRFWQMGWFDRLEQPERKTGEWILCSEMLPETHTEYVTGNPWMQVSITEDTYQLSDPVLGYGKRKYHSNGDPMMSVVWYEDDGYGRTAWTTAPDCEDIDVLAWMPLPEPYKGDES